MFINGLIHTEVYTVKLGETPVQIIKQVGQGKTFIHLHENEKTALAAAKLYIDRYNGTLITLKHKGSRNIIFRLKEKQYEFDPNRIFTDKGIKKTLQHYGPYSLAAHHQVKYFANEIKNLIPSGKVIAVHNNTNYSIEEYLPAHTMAGEIKAIHYTDKSNFRNFYFVTKLEEFQRLKKLKFNVALQTPTAQDDGSLSFYFSKKNYINIESAHGQLSRQMMMIKHA